MYQCVSEAVRHMVGQRDRNALRRLASDTESEMRWTTGMCGVIKVESMVTAGMQDSESVRSSYKRH